MQTLRVNRATFFSFLLLMLVSLLMGGQLVGCGPSDSVADAGDAEMSRPSEFGFQTSVRTTLIDEGREAYQIYCIGCHGEKGDGNGEAARFLHPRPRNFINARYKFSSTRAGRLPSDDDLRRTIVEGLKGSSMPGWDMIPARTVTAMIAYLKTFSPKWTERSPASSVPYVDDPYRSKADKSEAIARGEVVYHGYAKCWSCHPSYVSPDKLNQHLVELEDSPRDAFRPNIHLAEGKPNAEGEMSYPPDFLRDYVRAGTDVEDLYRSIAAGITGTAMPTWIDSIELPSEENPDQSLVTRADVWAMAYYVRSLIIDKPARLAEGEFELRDRKQKILAVGEIPVPLTEEDVMGGDEAFDEDFEEEEFDEDE
ncbi:MAG: c-type cytochrome [Phycisphaerae bacterium]